MPEKSIAHARCGNLLEDCARIRCDLCRDPAHDHGSVYADNHRHATIESRVERRRKKPTRTRPNLELGTKHICLGSEESERGERKKNKTTTTSRTPSVNARGVPSVPPLCRLCNRRQVSHSTVVLFASGNKPEHPHATVPFQVQPPTPGIVR